MELTNAYAFEINGLLKLTTQQTFRKTKPKKKKKQKQQKQKF